MGSLAAISVCVLLVLVLYDGVDGKRGGGGKQGGHGRGHGHGHGHGGASNKINFHLGSLFPGDPKTQAEIQIYLDTLPRGRQKGIFQSLAHLNREAKIEYLLQISGVNKKEGENVPIVDEGGSTVINLAQLFPNEPELQSKIQVFLAGLDKETQNKIFYNLGNLDTSTQIQILKELIQLSQTPGIITITIDGEPIRINNNPSHIHIL